MNKKYWISAFVVGAVFGLVVASVMTFLDWRLNPGGVFHSDLSTEWTVVTETAVSWFFPVAAASSVLAALVLFLFSRVKRERREA